MSATRDPWGPVVGHDDEGTPLNRDGNPPRWHLYWATQEWPYEDEEEAA